jgi:hypothetical protein
MLEAALRFQRLLTPSVGVSFNPNAEGIVATPTEVYALDATGRPAKIRDDNCTYIRITLTALSHRTVPSCVVFITKIEQQRIPTAPFVDIPLYGTIP